MRIYLIQSGQRVLPTMSNRTSEHALYTLEKLGVEVILNARVKDYDRESLEYDTTEGKQKIISGAIIWTAGVRGNVPDGLDPGLVRGGNPEILFHYRDKGSMAIIGKKDAVADIKSVFFNGRVGWLIWSVIHLISLTGFKNKVAVVVNWGIKYFTYEKANQLIIRRYTHGIKQEITEKVLVEI